MARSTLQSLECIYLLKTTKVNTKVQLARMGIYVRFDTKEGKHYIGISKEGMKYLGLKSKFGIKSLRQLASELNTTPSTVWDDYSHIKVVKIFLD